MPLVRVKVGRVEGSAFEVTEGGVFFLKVIPGPSANVSRRQRKRWELMERISCAEALKHDNILQAQREAISGDLATSLCRWPEAIVYRYPVCELGDLFEVIDRANKGSLYYQVPVAHVKTIFKQIVRGIAHLHENNLAHCDVKPENVGVRADGTVVLIDFGCAHEADAIVSCAGTLSYNPPGDTHLATQMDVFQLGVTFFALLCGYPVEMSHSHRARMVMERNFRGLLFEAEGMREHATLEAMSIIAECCDPDPDLRTTPGELLYHPYFGSYLHDDAFEREAFEAEVLEAEERGKKELARWLQSLNYNVVSELVESASVSVVAEDDF